MKQPNYAFRMEEAADMDDKEESHKEADRVLCEALLAFAIEAGHADEGARMIAEFQRMTKWYS